MLAVCHSCVPELKKEGKLEYHGSSPDESALVRGVSHLGIIFETRTPEHVVIKKLGKQMKYYTDYTIEFNSDRKRSSVIVHTDEGNYVIYTKGAVSVIWI